MIKQIRFQFMEVLLLNYGRFNRRSVEQMFDLQTVQVSRDIQEFLSLHEGGVVYDKKQRTYVRTDAFEPKYVASEPAAA